MSDKKPKVGPDTGTSDSKPKLYRNLKPKLAPPDHPLYRIGFVVGGRRLSSFDDDPEKESDKEAEKK